MNSRFSNLKNSYKKQENIDQYKLSEIEIVADNKAMEKDLLEIKSQIKEIGFEATAIKFSIAPSSSNGGEIGWISGKSMNKEIFKRSDKRIQSFITFRNDNNYKKNFKSSQSSRLEL